MSVCMDAISGGDSEVIRYAIEAFLMLVTPSMIRNDEIYVKQIEEIEGDWKKDYDERYKEYIELAISSDCADVINKPLKEHDSLTMKKKYVVTQALFERRGLLLQEERTENQ